MEECCLSVRSRYYDSPLRSSGAGSYWSHGTSDVKHTRRSMLAKIEDANHKGKAEGTVDDERSRRRQRRRGHL